MSSATIAELQRRRQPVHARGRARPAGARSTCRNRRAHAGQPDEELLEQRLVEAVERAQPVDVGLAGAGRQHHGDRIARRDADHHEDHDGHAEQRDRPWSAGGSRKPSQQHHSGKHAIASPPKSLRLFGQCAMRRMRRPAPSLTDRLQLHAKCAPCSEGRRARCQRCRRLRPASSVPAAARRTCAAPR